MRTTIVQASNMAPQGPMTGHCKMFIEKTNDCNQKKKKAMKNNLKYLKRKVKEGKASEEEKQKIAALEEKLKKKK